jgi:tetratricopeptide (TPR) repeat protein
MYTSVRAFCDGLAKATPAHQRSLREAQHRHADHFARLGDPEFLLQLKRHGGAAKRRRLHAELGNILWAVDVSIGAGRIEVAARCAMAAANIYEIQGPIVAGRSALHQVLDAQMEASQTRSRVFRMLAYLDFLVENFDHAASHFESAEADAQADSDQDPSALHSLHLSDIARVHIARGDLLRAADCYAETIEAFTATNEVDGLVRAYVNQGDLKFALGDFDGARSSGSTARRQAAGSPSRG